MCFSAAASFTAGAALTLTGGATISQARKKSDLLFASTPLLFGMQQFIEGVIWITFGMPALQQVMSFMFLLFSHVLWPTFVPLSVMLIERTTWRRNVLKLFVGIGLVVSLYFLFFLLIERVSTEMVFRSIVYSAPHFSVTFILSPYTVATCASCLFSSHRIVNIFGVVTFLSAVIAFRFFEHAFVSVWCFFAALLSVIILVHFRSERIKAWTMRKTK